MTGDWQRNGGHIARRLFFCRVQAKKYVRIDGNGPTNSLSLPTLY
jgi:hypothetical protein